MGDDVEGNIQVMDRCRIMMENCPITIPTVHTK